MTSREDVYGAFVDYYGNLKLKVIKVDAGWVFYGAKVSSGLNENRYIFVIVPQRLAPAEEATLEQLDWVSFQTRTTTDVHQVPTHNLYLDETRKQMIPDKITVVDRTADETHYVTDSLPIKVRLIHDPKKNNYLQYPDQAFMYQALETFRCVVDML